VLGVLTVPLACASGFILVFSASTSTRALTGGLLVALGVLLAYGWLVMLINRRVTTISDEGIRRRPRPLPWWGGFSVPREAVARTRVVERKTARGGAPRPRYDHVGLHAVLRDGSERVLLTGDEATFPREALERVGQRIEDDLAIPGTPVEHPDPGALGRVER
jgi:hypothetical protein